MDGVATLRWMARLALAALAGAGCAGEAVETTEPPSDRGEISRGGGGGVSATGSGGAGAVEPEGGPVYPDPEWPEGAPEDHGLDQVALDEAARIASELDSYCLLVFRHGVLVAESYWSGHDATTPQLSWSIAKSHASATVGVAIARGDIASLDQSVAEHVPAWQGSAHEAITYRHVLSMTSGLTWSAFDDYVSLATFAQDHSEHAVALDVAQPPGTEWIYHNGAVQVLEPAFRGATGTTIEAYAQEHLWSKIGIQATWAHDPSGNPTVYASVLASCRDHAKLGYLYRHGGKWKDEQIVPASFVAESLAPTQAMNRAYGLLWWLNGDTPALDAMMQPWPGRMSPMVPADMFAARGFGNQFVDVIPSLDMMVVRFGKDATSSFDLAAMLEDQRFAKHDAILAAVLAAVKD